MSENVERNYTIDEIQDYFEASSSLEREVEAGSNLFNDFHEKLGIQSEIEDIRKDAANLSGKISRLLIEIDIKEDLPVIESGVTELKVEFPTEDLEILSEFVADVIPNWTGRPCKEQAELLALKFLNDVVLQKRYIELPVSLTPEEIDQYYEFALDEGYKTHESEEETVRQMIMTMVHQTVDP